MEKRGEKKPDKIVDPYREIIQLLEGKPNVLLGTVAAKAPSSPTANNTYVWTRKIRAKTVSQALSKEQYDAFQKAIGIHRQIESRLNQIRETSTLHIFESIPGVKKKGTHKRHPKKP